MEFIGTISKNLFGLATTKDINILKQHIVALETEPETFKGFQKFEQQLSSAQIETNENLKRIHEDIIQNRKHINETFNELDILERTLTRDEATQQAVSMVDALSVRQITRMMMTLTDLDKLIDS